MCGFNFYQTDLKVRHALETKKKKKAQSTESLISMIIVRQMNPTCEIIDFPKQKSNFSVLLPTIFSSHFHCDLLSQGRVQLEVASPETRCNRMPASLAAHNHCIGEACEFFASESLQTEVAKHWTGLQNCPLKKMFEFIHGRSLVHIFFTRS
jgi:hypothetical protein